MVGIVKQWERELEHLKTDLLSVLRATRMPCHINTISGVCYIYPPLVTALPLYPCSRTAVLHCPPALIVHPVFVSDHAGMTVLEPTSSSLIKSAIRTARSDMNHNLGALISSYRLNTCHVER